MTVLMVANAPRKYTGLSTDTKPTIASHGAVAEPTPGSTFFETNTQTMYLTHDGTTWGLKEPWGEVKTSPTANTVLGRLKALLTGIVLAAGTAIIGRVGHNSTGIGHGVETCDTAGTGQAIVTSSTPAKRVNVQAQTDNTSAIAVGASAAVDATVATGNGILLYAGDWAGWLNVDNLADVYFDALVQHEGVRFIYET